MSEQKQDTLDKVYEELEHLRDEIGLKLHLAGMDLRDQWTQLESDWNTWTHQVAKDLGAEKDKLEARLREAGGDDLRKIEISTDVAISRLKRGFREIADKLGEEKPGDE